MPLMLRALWQYRSFVASSIRNDYVTRFARSKFGAAWAILNPLSMVVIYALILSNILQAKLVGIESQYSFAIYLTAGVLCFNLFSEIVSRSLNVFIANGNLIKKAMFPKIVLPAIVVGTCLLDNVLLFVAILLVFAMLGHIPGIEIIWLPVLVITTTALGLGVGLILGILNVFVRDIAQVVPIILQVLFWFTPIVYPLAIIPEKYQPLLYLNPIFPLVRAYQDALVFSTSPNIFSISLAFLMGASLMLFSLLLFSRANEEMADLL
ncbi:ABC transporter permease [Arenicellales bacterium IMCC58067]